MVELSHNLNLSLYLWLHLVLPDFLLAYDLYRNVKSGGLVDCLDDFSERALAQRLEKRVILQLQLRRRATERRDLIGTRRSRRIRHDLEWP